MANLEHDVDLKLDHDDAQALLRARIDERKKLIEANNLNRKRLRKEKDGKDAKSETDAATAATASAATHKASFDASKAAAKVKHAVVGEPAEEHFDPARGVLILKAQPTALVQGKPAVERKRLAMTDKQCDDYAASYAASCTACDEAYDLQRQIEDYKAAHPELFAGSPGGEPPPVDPAYEALKDALEAKQAIIQAEHAKQGAITQSAIGAEQVTYSVRIDIATGDVVLGDRPSDEE